MNQKLIMENWRRFVKTTSPKPDMGHLYLFEGRKIKKVSFEKRLNQLNESNRSLEKFVKEWEKSCNYTFKLLEQKQPLNESNLEHKIGVQILMMVSKIKKWSMKLIMPILRVISKASKYMNKYPILKKIAKISVMLILLAVAAAGGDGDYTEFLNWIVSNADAVDLPTDVVDGASAALQVCEDSGDCASSAESIAKNMPDLQGEIKNTVQEVGADNQQLADAAEKVTNTVSSTVEQGEDHRASALDVDGRTQADIHGTAKSRGTEWSIDTRGTGKGDQSKGYTTFTLKGKGHLPTVAQHYSPGQEVEFYMEKGGNMVKVPKNMYMELQQQLLTKQEYNELFKKFNVIMQKNIQ